MKKTSVVAIPSLMPEPLPYTLLESMLCGKLVIASNVGGMPEMVDGAPPGVKLVKPADSKEIADALASFLMLGLEETNEVGVRNREYILEKFDNEKATRFFIDTLNKVTS